MTSWSVPYFPEPALRFPSLCLKLADAYGFTDWWDGFLKCSLFLNSLNNVNKTWIDWIFDLYTGISRRAHIIST